MVLASPLVWWAIVLIIASFISWLYVLRYIPLSFAYPLSRVVDIPCSAWLLDFSRRTDFHTALVRNRAGGFRPGFGGKANRKNGGALVTFLAFCSSLFRWSRLSQRSSSLRKRWNSQRRTVCATPTSQSRVAIGVVLMTVSFFLTLGLLQRFDLSYLYPFKD
jgi:hypothetical protein